MEPDSRKYTHLVFDIDGTLLDTENAVLLSLQEVTEKMLQRKIDIIDLRFALGIPGKDAIDQLGIDNFEEANTLWIEAFKKQTHTIKLFNGIVPMLDYLKSNFYTLGIITSKTKDEFKNDFCPFGISEYFDIIICAEDTIKHKPDAEPMKKYLELSKANTSKVLYIGDTIYDNKCAEGANVEFALALWGCKDSKKINPKFSLKYPSDIINILK